MAIKNFGVDSIHTYLLDKTLFIPEYQREYSWEIDQLDDFWQDLTHTINEDRLSHFFGQVVIHENSADGKFYLIDGQQRTTTSVIFLAVIRDCVTQFNDISQDIKEDAERIKEDIRVKYIGRYSLSQNDLHLQLGENDREFFRDHVQRKYLNEKPKTPSQKRILDAYSYFKKQFDALFVEKKDEECFEIVKKYYDVFIKNFKVMSITTDDINEAFIIFETLNARGKDLETADLLKNYVIMLSEKDRSSVQKKWAHMMDSLANRDHATKFIRYFWNAHNGFTHERGLYKTITSSIDAKKSIGFVDSLDKSVDLYNAMVDPTNNTYFSNNNIKAVLANLSILGASTFYPLMFAMNTKAFEEDDILKVLYAIETLVVRNFVVGGLTAKKFEQSFSIIAVDIVKKDLSIEGILEAIAKDTNDDEKFERDLIGLSIKTAATAKYILREIEDLDAGEKITNKDNKVINLEHILPKKAKKWNVSEEFFNKNINKLANQALLLEEYNKSISNNIFSEKKIMYAQSAIESTKMLCNYNQWTDDEINARDRYLRDRIVKRWKIIK